VHLEASERVGMAGKQEVCFLFKCVKEGKITGDEAINIIGKGGSSATTRAIGIVKFKPKIHSPTLTAGRPTTTAKSFKKDFTIT